MKIPISVIILAQEETTKLAAAVKSVEWAEEVMVVKSVKPITDFAEARNTAAQKARCEWVFFLDSDEVFRTGDEQKLAELLSVANSHNNSNEAFDGALIKRRDIFLEKELHWGEVTNVKLLRLVRKKKVHFVRPVHEVCEVNGKTADTDIIIFHYAHDSISSFWQKILSYIQIEAQLRTQQKEQISLWQIFVWPTGKFIYNYLFRLGIVDGWRGLIYATLMSVHSFGLRVLLYEAQHQQNPPL